MTTRIRPKLTESVMLCRACDTYFRGLTIFDKHRRNAHGPSAHPQDGPPRICIPPELVGLVHRDDRGYWAGPPMTDDERARMTWAEDDTTPVSTTPDAPEGR